MNDHPRLQGDRGAITIHTVVVTLTILGAVGVVVIGIALAVSGFTKGGLILLALFAVQAFYGWTLYRRIPRPDIAALQHEPADEPADELVGDPTGDPADDA
jgi:hypothetical protein